MCCAAAWVLAAAGSLAAAQQPAFRSGVQVVEVDVRVFDTDGRFVGGLTVDDFELLENGVPQRLQSADLVGTATGDNAASANPEAPARVGPATKPAPTAAPRQTWIFFFDLNHLTPGNGFDRARKAVEEFVASRFKEGDLAGVLAGSTMANNRLTSIREELVTAVKAVKPTADARNRFIELTREWPRLRDEADALLIANENKDAIRRAVMRACTDEPEACRVTPPDLAVREKAKRLQREFERTSLDTLRTLNSLAAGLAKLPGQKTVVLLSDGFVIDDVATTVQTVVGQIARAGTRVYSIDVRGLNRGGGTDPAQMLADDPAGGPPRVDTTADGPNSLAVDTGGAMIRNQNNIGRALEQIEADARRYYLLTYQPQNTVFDGKFRSIEVRVKREGVRVRARKGYLAVEAPRSGGGEQAAREIR